MCYWVDTVVEFSPDTALSLTVTALAICLEGILEGKLKDWLTSLLLVQIHLWSRAISKTQMTQLPLLPEQKKALSNSLSAVLDPFGKQPVSYSSNQRVFLRDLQAGQEASAGVISNC